MRLLKTIDTLVDDIYTVLIADRLAQNRAEPSLRMSNLGSPCERKLYYTINEPGRREPLPPEVCLKFIFGDILEAVLLLLAKSAGHSVEAQQEEVDINGVKGHLDAIIDGTVVDCKSASTQSFKKFESGLLPDGDAFGYLDQLGGYGYATRDDPRVTDKKRAAFLVVDKTLGKLCLDVQHVTDTDYAEVVEHKRSILSRSVPPPRPYFDEAEGKSGNRKLGTVCSYCDFKRHCWPGLRAYAYSGAPKFLTQVVKEPDVLRIY